MENLNKQHNITRLSRFQTDYNSESLCSTVACHMEFHDMKLFA